MHFSWRLRRSATLCRLPHSAMLHQRLLDSIGYISLAEAEANFHRQQAGQAMAA